MSLLKVILIINLILPIITGMKNSIYTEAFEEKHSGILVLDNARTILNVNYIFASMLGYDHKALLLLSFRDLFESESDYESVLSTISDAQERGESINFKSQLRSKEGVLVWVEISSDTLGLSPVLILTVTDIFKRLEAKQRLQFLLEGSNDGLWEWDLLTNEVYFSARWKEMLGFRDDELKNEFSTWERRLNLEDKESVLEEVQKSIAGEADHFVNIHRLRHKDGHWVWIYVRAKTFFDTHGKAVYMAGFHTDISALKEAQKDSEQQYLLLRSMFDATPDLIYYKDYQVEGGRYIGCNSAFEKFVGMKESEIIGKNDQEIFGAELGNSHYEDDKEVLRARKSGIREEWVTYPDDTKVLLHTLKAPFYDDKGKLLGLFGISRDMTEIHNAQEKVKEHHKQILFQARLAQMGEMITMIVHQWRQPLNNLSLVVNNLYLDHMMQELTDEKLKKSIEQSQAIIKSMTHTIDDFRNFYQQHQLSKMTHIDDVIEKSLDITENTLIVSNIRLKRSYTCSKEIQLHEGELMQVFLNIFKNAQDNFKERDIKEPELEIVTSDTKKGIKIEIIDNGGGIDPAHIEKIFEPYFTTKYGQNGTGLGLYMSKMIIEEHHHGKIYAQNTEDGVSFVIEL